MISLLNRKCNSLGPPKKPSNLLMYLLFSNMASFIYYLRLWNGQMIVQKYSNHDGIPLDLAIPICEALITQLLSKES